VVQQSSTAIPSRALIRLTVFGGARTGDACDQPGRGHRGFLAPGEVKGDAAGPALIVARSTAADQVLRTRMMGLLNSVSRAMIGVIMGAGLASGFSHPAVGDLGLYGWQAIHISNAPLFSPLTASVLGSNPGWPSRPPFA
jgi:hypothetical protein